jgi:hypothetical protein
MPAPRGLELWPANTWPRLVAKSTVELSAGRLNSRFHGLKLHGAGRLKRPHELAQNRFAIRVGDDQQRVGGEYGVAADANSMAKRVGLAEMVGQPGARFGVGHRAALGRVLVAHDKQTHGVAHTW